MVILVHRFSAWNMKQKTCYIHVEVQRLDAFENSALKKIFEKRERKYVIGTQRKLLIQCFVIYHISWPIRCTGP
jgi:hypothetical protein